MRRGIESSFLLTAVFAMCFLAACSRGSVDAANPSEREGTAEAGAAPANGFAPDAPEARRENPGLMTRMGQSLGVVPKPVVYTVEPGTPLRVRTTSTISTKNAQSGEIFYASLAEPLVVGDKVIAPRGADVMGRVVHADPGGRVKGVASLSVTLASLQVATGDEVRLDTTNVGRRARTTKKKDAMKIGIGSGVGAAIGALAGGGKGAAIGAAVGGGAGTGMVVATHGDPAVIPAESLLTFTTEAPIQVAF